MIRRQAKVYKAGILAGVLQELEDRWFRFEYLPDYQGPRQLLAVGQDVVGDVTVEPL